jgi:hypothetical protein
VDDSTGPTTITDNFIDATQNADAPGAANSAVRLTYAFGDLYDVTVSGNYLLGGGYTVQAGDMTSTYTVSNESITNNEIGFWAFAPFYPSGTTGETVTGNTIVDFSNPTASTQALAAYQAAGLPTANVVSGTSGGAAASGSAPTTLLGNGIASVHLAAASGETNFVGGFGPQELFGGQGADILTYLAIGDGGDRMSDSIRRRT